ncbi:hypothetical protein DBV15_05146 [Temnothorax longispinosus]|uniref:Uncharacterized protein n=1 Tax=Temnothorax longispinosus TaxID=300112 RepID=A0A4S2KZV0_9HYME|nr:hypothetical protein DBV15_05146 [Temnothorax longispinosus]
MTHGDPPTLLFSRSLIPLPSHPLTAKCVSIGIGYRTTNASFANDNHPQRSLRSLRSLTAATNYYPPLNPGIAERERRAALRRAKPRQADRVRHNAGKKNRAAEIRSVSRLAVTGRRADISALCAKNASREMRELVDRSSINDLILSPRRHCGKCGHGRLSPANIASSSIREVTRDRQTNHEAKTNETDA